MRKFNPNRPGLEYKTSCQVLIIAPIFPERVSMLVAGAKASTERVTPDFKRLNRITRMENCY